MGRCTCDKDPSITCIVHPRRRRVMSISKELVKDLRESQERIAELEATIAELEKDQQELVYDCRDWRIKCEALREALAWNLY